MRRRHQGIGSHRAPLVGTQHLAVPFGSLAILAVKPGARHFDLYPAKDPRQRPRPMAMPVTGDSDQAIIIVVAGRFWAPTVSRRSSAAGFAGHSVAATRKLLQERGETFRDRLIGGIVLGPEPLPEFPQPWPPGQDVTTFGLARPTLPALAPTH